MRASRGGPANRATSTVGRVLRSVGPPALALVVATTYAAAGTPAPTARTTSVAATPGVWHTAAKLSHGNGAEISCATASSCWAIAGGELLRSQDAAASWSVWTPAIPAEVDALDALDCPTARVCFVTARTEDLGLAALVLRGEAITAAPVPGSGRLRSISCRSGAACLTTDGTTTSVTTDGGATWRARPRALPTTGVPDLSCVTGTTTCWAVGHFGPTIARTTDFGVTWTLQPRPSAVGTLLGIDCPTTSECFAVGSEFSSPVVAATYDAGASWTRLALPPQSGQLRSVSCPSEQTCFAFGATYAGPLAFATADAGASWWLQDLGTSGGAALAVSCATPSVCATAGSDGFGLTTSTSGATWTPSELPVALGTATHLSCATADRCVAMSRDAHLRPLALVSTDGGVTWTRHPLPERTGSVTDLDCATATTCFAWAYRLAPNSPRTVGQALVTDDGGATWRLHQGPDTRGLATAELSCPAATTCVAVGTPGTVHGQMPVLVTTDAGLTWTPKPVPGLGTPVDVACSSATSCVLLAHSNDARRTVVAVTTSDLGDSYQQRDLAPVALGYGALDCAGSRCYAVGNRKDWRGAVAQSYDGGATWREQAVPADAYHLVDVSCGTPRSCAVSGSDGSQDGQGAQMMGTTNAGGVWTTYEIPWAGASWPTAVACAGTACLASDYSSNELPRILAGSP